MRNTIIITSFLFLIACFTLRCSNENENPGKVVIHEPQPNLLSGKAKTIIGWLRDHRFDKISTQVHPEKGLTFSPYGHIDSSVAPRFTPTEVANLWNTNPTETWGYYDGSGEDIYYTFHEFYREFIMDKDFSRAPETGTDTLMGVGNTLINIQDIYPGSRFVSFYFPGFEEKYDGMDWECLRLIFQPAGDEWLLVAIVHDQWTI